MPIYQNCTSGHWKHGNAKFPWLGTLVHYTALVWGMGFFVLQILCSDCVRFYFFLTGGQVKTLTELWEIQTPGVDAFHPFSYHGALVVMWVMYLVLMLSGFTPFHVKLQGRVLTSRSASFQNVKNHDEGVLEQRCSAHEYEPLIMTSSSSSSQKSSLSHRRRTSADATRQPFLRNTTAGSCCSALSDDDDDNDDGYGEQVEDSESV